MIYRVIVRETVNKRLLDHLLSRVSPSYCQEEVCFSLWYPGDGVNCYTGILGDPILPNADDRNLHGNVTVHGGYVNRVLDCAMSAKAGVAVMHSHPFGGWQDLSPDDEDTERNILLPYVRETGLPLLGLTLANDGTWSARFWRERRIGEVQLAQCRRVHRVGPRMLSIDSKPSSYPSYSRRTILKRTLDCWGLEAQAKLARTHICVVGAGSVGSMVLESLARTGIEQITVIDDDEVELHNLDRLIYADRRSVGKKKVKIVARYLRRIATASDFSVHAVPLSIRTERAYRLAADSDLIVCCVDNAEARDVLNHLSYSNCLPLIDGGVLVDSPEGRLVSAKWRVHLVGPDMKCIRCREQYTSSEAADERQKLREQGRYIDDPDPEDPEPGQNTFAFCNIVAGEEIRILLRYLVGKPWWHDSDPTNGRWALEHQFVDAATIDFKHPNKCVASCEFTQIRLGRGILGRPSYPFESEPHETWKTRIWRGLKRVVRLILPVKRPGRRAFGDFRCLLGLRRGPCLNDTRR